MPCALPDGQMTDLFGQEVAPVRVSQRREKAEGLMTLAISGLLGHDSSQSADLQRSLENRLMTRLDTGGSTLFKLTWKGRRTPLGRRYLERAASVLRTSGKGCTSVPTPTQEDHKMDGPKALGRLHSGEAMTCDFRLRNMATLATVPTPMAGSPATETYNAAGNNDYSRKIVELASVCSPTAQDCSRGGRPARPWDTGVPLTQQVALATVTSPSAHDWKDYPGMSETGVDPDGSIRTRLDQLPRQAQLAASGETATGGTAETASTGQLNPDYSRWLMGLPTVFSNCADTAMQSFRRLPRNSSKRISKSETSEEVRG
jgi:hypothetical protein